MRLIKSFKDFKLGYVLLEVLIVTIGILMALQIDNWKEGRNRKEQELRILREIRASLMNDVTALTSSVNSCENIISHLAKLEQYLYENGTYNDSLQEYAIQAIYAHQFQGRTSAYDNLKFSGVDLISNDSIKYKLSELYDDIYLRLRETLHFTTSEFSPLPYFSRQLIVDYQLNENSELKTAVILNPKVFSEKEFLYNVSFKLSDEKILMAGFESVRKKALQLIEDITVELQQN